MGLYDCPPWLTSRRCSSIGSRFLEDTFRSIPLQGRAPSHVEPPFRSLPFVVLGQEQTVPGGPYGPGNFVDTACRRVFLAHWRAEVWFIGHAAEGGAAWADLEWRITIDGKPYDPYTAFRMQLGQMAPATKLCTPIHLRAGQLICFQARSLSGADHVVSTLLCGWQYALRSDAGDEIKSTIVD